MHRAPDEAQRRTHCRKRSVAEGDSGTRAAAMGSRSGAPPVRRRQWEHRARRGNGTEGRARTAGVQTGARR
eukprot:92318-Alexandrium_andersonii.AAC.1